MRKRIAALLLSALALPAFGGGASHWSQTSEADFKKGAFQNVVATNLGDLKLSRAVKTLMEQDPRISTVYSMVEAPDGTIYAGTGPNGVLLQLKGEKVSTLLKLDDENIFSLLVDQQGRLVIGTGGEKGRILRVDKPGEKPTQLLAPDGVQYIWQLRQTPDGTIYAATGPNGQLFELHPNGSSDVLFDCDENNILSLVTDGKDLLYLGTDPNGLVYRINRRTKDVFVLFDAPESEISAMVLDKKGNLYVGTGQASDNDSAAGEQAEPEKQGRPEGGEQVVPLPNPAPKEPKPPKAPEPNPGEPNPIPKHDNLILPHRPFDPGVLFDIDDPGDGADQAPRPNPNPGAAPRNPIAANTPPNAAPNLPNPEGNAIYKIDPDGFVTEVFRHPVMVLSMVEKDGLLLVGTGSEGLVYQVNPAAEETIVLAKVDPKQVMSMLPAKDGRVILGLANVGSLASMSSGFAPEGTYTSPVLDAGQISRFGKIHLSGSLPAGTTLSVSTRSGNLQTPNDATWSKWTAEKPASEYLGIGAPSARFLQYRLTFSSSQGKETPVVDAIDVSHQLPNLSPQIKSIKIASADPDNAPNAAPPATSKPRTSDRIRQITWEASDPNGDTLDYVLHFRTGTSGPWILLADKLKDPTYTWDTKGVPDGRYQVRVTASDAKANPRGEGKTSSRVSNPVIVDNTPPVIGDMHVTKTGKGVKIEASVVDRTGIVQGVDYAVDSKDDWQAVQASDNIFDSPQEGVSLTVDDLPTGVHQIMLRASDDHGNQSFETIQVNVGGDK